MCPFDSAILLDRDSNETIIDRPALDLQNDAASLTRFCLNAP
jgi:hypothetical protein